MAFQCLISGFLVTLVLEARWGSVMRFLDEHWKGLVFLWFFPRFRRFLRKSDVEKHCG